MFNQLKEYCKKDICPFHMPGHKRNIDLLGNDLPYEYDITEINGFDYLHSPDGIIKNVQEKAKKIYNCEHSFMLVNGSTCGVLAAIRTITEYGDKVLVARNCHKSVYNAIELNGLDAVYILPEYNGEFNIHTVINPDSVKIALENNPDIKAVILTSPTYEGFVSNIQKIAETAHSHNIPLFVDEAHGAHFGLSDFFPPDALSCGADIAVLGLHKTLPALTQCALLNVKSNLINIPKLKEQLSIFETSSPSYILMSSIDKCLSIITEQGEKLFSDYYNNLKYFYKTTENLKSLKVFRSFSNFDIGKIVISTLNTNINGTSLSEILRNDYSIEVEMSYDSYIIAMTSICDTKKCFERLSCALSAIDDNISSDKKNKLNTLPLSIPAKALSISETKKLSGETVGLINSIGRIALEYIFAYPPGIPIIVPGEVIDKTVIEEIINLQKADIELKNATGSLKKGIYVLK